MATQTTIPVAEYLSTSYHPDCEYVDGVLTERNWGEKDHSRLQTLLAYLLMLRRTDWGIQVFTEQRVQVKATRFRVPDLCVVAGAEPDEQIFTSPPLVCIEILSRDDRWADVQDKIEDYLAFGVPYVWVIDPRSHKAYEFTAAGMHPVAELRTAEPPILVPVAGLFE